MAKIEGIDVPFGPPPEEYLFNCSHCNHEYKVDEVIIDAAIGWAKFEGYYHEGFMPKLGCPNCNQETLIYEE